MSYLLQLHAPQIAVGFREGFFGECPTGPFTDSNMPSSRSKVGSSPSTFTVDSVISASNWPDAEIGDFPVNVTSRLGFKRLAVIPCCYTNRQYRHVTIRSASLKNHITTMDGFRASISKWGLKDSWRSIAGVCAFVITSYHGLSWDSNRLKF